MFLDGPKSMYLDVLELVETRVRAGGIVASDNTNHEGLKPFLEYLRTPGDGYASAAILTAGDRGPRGHEIAIRH